MGKVSGSNITFTFNEGGNIFTGEGTLNGTTISGTYSGSNPNCLVSPDSGKFTATKVSGLGGTFSSGTFISSAGSYSDQVTATLNGGSNNSLTMQFTFSGPDVGTYQFSGSAIGNVAFISGIMNGSAVSLFGYFDSSGTYTGVPNSIAVFNLGNAYVGLLVKQGSGSSTPTSIAGNWTITNNIQSASLGSLNNNLNVSVISSLCYTPGGYPNVGGIEAYLLVSGPLCFMADTPTGMGSITSTGNIYYPPADVPGWRGVSF